MCGIVGYIGKKSAAPILLNGLKRLEYRGYDSAGISVIVDSRIEQVKAKGKLSVLSEILENKPVMSNMGIAHTRWATHGAPSNQNSHPHSDCRNEFSLVHNGIIENYLELKKELEEKGHRFKSETDTEVLVHLIEELYNGDLVQAVIDTLKRVEGSYGIGVISSKEPDKIIAARQDSPLVIGRSDNGNFIGSDIPAFLHFTRYVQHIKDREIVIITGDDVKIMDFDRNQVQRPITKVLWNAGMAQKSGFKHFMLKEIFEQPKVINDVLKGRLSGNGVEIEEFHISDQEINKLNKIVITACGTAYYAGMIGKYFIEEFTRIPVEIDVASELRYRNPVIDENTLMIAISQSGETADTLAS
ncbi:MAG: glutamine--fructose-6-phosphate transaminase (isomerizing), partial [Vulcanimicrobiota bacterium]